MTAILFTISISLSILISASNSTMSIIRLIGELSTYQDLVRFIYAIKIIVEPFAIISFYAGLIMFSINLIKSTRNNQKVESPR